jgi:hypothetical protein
MAAGYGKKRFAFSIRMEDLDLLSASSAQYLLTVTDRLLNVCFCCNLNHKAVSWRVS